MTQRRWVVEWVNGWLTDPSGRARAPVWPGRPAYRIAHELIDGWAHDTGVAARIPRLGTSMFWWPLRFVFHRTLSRMLPQILLLLEIRGEAGSGSPEIVLDAPPEPWYPGLFRLVFPAARVSVRGGGGDDALRHRLAHARVFVRRALATSRRLRRFPTARQSRPRVLVLSQDRMWNGVRDHQLDSVITALARGGMDPVVLSRSWGSPEHRLFCLRTRPSHHLFMDHVLARHALLRGYPRPPRLEVPPSGFAVQGLDIGPLVGGILQGAVDHLYRQRAALYRSVPDLVRALGARTALVTDENGGSHGLKMGMLRAGIPVVAMQHGVIHRDHLSYMYPDDADPATIPLCRETCVYGDWYRDLLVKESVYSEAAVTVTGHAQMDSQAGTGGSPQAGEALRRELLSGDGDRLLFFTSQGEFRELTAPLLLDGLARSRPGNVLVVRPHPQEKTADFWRNAIEQHGVGGRAHIRSDGALADWLRACDVHLSVSSTVLSEAALFDKPNILVASRTGGDFCGCLEAEVGVDLADFPSLDDAVDHWLRASPDAAREHADRRRRYALDHFHRVDGRAGERVAAVVERVLSS